MPVPQASSTRTTRETPPPHTPPAREPQERGTRPVPPPRRPARTPAPTTPVTPNLVAPTVHPDTGLEVPDLLAFEDTLEPGASADLANRPKKVQPKTKRRGLRDFFGAARRARQNREIERPSHHSAQWEPEHLSHEDPLNIANRNENQRYSIPEATLVHSVSESDAERMQQAREYVPGREPVFEAREVPAPFAQLNMETHPVALPAPRPEEPPTAEPIVTAQVDSRTPSEIAAVIFADVPVVPGVPEHIPPIPRASIGEPETTSEEPIAEPA